MKVLKELLTSIIKMGNDTFEYLFLHLISNNTQSTNCFLSIRLFMARNLRVALYYSDSTTETVN